MWPVVKGQLLPSHGLTGVVQLAKNVFQEPGIEMSDPS